MTQDYKVVESGEGSWSLRLTDQNLLSSKMGELVHNMPLTPDSAETILLGKDSLLKQPDFELEAADVRSLSAYLTEVERIYPNATDNPSFKELKSRVTEEALEDLSHTRTEQVQLLHAHGALLGVNIPFNNAVSGKGSLQVTPVAEIISETERLTTQNRQLSEQIQKISLQNDRIGGFL